MLAVVDLLVLICAITLPLLYFAYQNLSRRISADHSPPVSKHERTDQQRQAGEWQSTVFDYPPVTPCNDTLENIPPRAYRPFKEGTYHVTMGIRNLDFNEWIELDSEFLNYHHIRAARIAERGSKLVQVLPDRSVVRGAGPAAEELVQELCEFLSRRYPSVYQVTRDSSSQGWYGSGEVTEIKILLTGEHFDLRVDEPMKVAAMLIPDDLAILIEGNDGKYYLQGGAIVVPGTWRLDDKIGMPLDEIHITGEVPYYQERLQPSMTRFFTKLQIARPVVRNNWFFQSVEPRDERDPEELAWYTSILGHEDHFSHPLSSYKREIGAEPSPADTSARVNATAAPPSIDRLRLRSERQTLRRLPRSGAIVFTVRTYKTPIATLVKEPGMAQRLARALRAVKASAPEVYSRMLSKDGLEKLLLEYLDAQC